MNHQENENKFEFENFKEFSLMFPKKFKVETTRTDTTVKVWFYPKSTDYVRFEERQLFRKCNGKLFCINGRAYICEEPQTVIVNFSPVVSSPHNYSNYSDPIILILKAI